MIIGLTGLKGSGKSTVADYLISEYGFRPVSFAQPLKDSVAALFGITVEQIEEMKNDPYVTVTLTLPNGMRATISFREFLQRYGTEAHREIPEFGQNIWTDMAARKMDDSNIVIADVRFDNEAETIKRVGGVVIRIDREAVEMDDQHESEAGLSGHLIDLDLDNNGTLEELETRVDILMHGRWNVSLPGAIDYA